MKRLVALVLMLTIIFPCNALALDLGGVLGGLTSMLVPNAEDASTPGETAEIDDIQVTLTNVHISGKNDFYTPADEYEYVIIEFSFVNNSKDELSLSTMLSFSAWCDGQMHSISREALGTAMFAGKMQLDCVVESGETVVGIIRYEVPEEWKEMIIEYKKDTIIGKPIKFAFENNM